MHSILVCDDNKEFLKLMVLLLEKYSDYYHMTVTGFENGRELLMYCREYKPDLIYMDIKLKGRNGMLIGKTIKSMHPKTLIIYISAYDDYYVDMVQAEPFRFIPKDAADIPKLERQISDTLEAAMRRIDGRETLTFRFKRKTYGVELRKIKYFHSIARTIHLAGEFGNTPSYFYGKMDELQMKLEKTDDNFVRISKSYIINMKYRSIVN